MTLSIILTHLALVVAALVFAILDGVPLSYPKVMLLIKEMIKENIRS